MRFCCAAVLWALLALPAVWCGITPPKSLSLSKMIVDNNHPSHPFKDKDGRIRVFHGINRVKKGFPWYPPLMVNDTHLDQVASWGFNVIRLGTMWSGVETKPYEINNTYLDIMEGIVKGLAKRGVYVIIDMHQDALSSEFNMYDGAPKWLIDSFPEPMEPFPYPFPKPPSNWNFNYLTVACGSAFENIYNNVSHALDHLGVFWGNVSKRFGHYDNVLGFEIINEPFPGNIYRDPTLFIPGKAGSEVLQPFYDKVVKFIRAEDDRSLVFYEPVTWGMILHGDTWGSGFTHVPGGDNYRNRSVMSFHYYCWPLGQYSPAPYPEWLKLLCDSLFFPEVLASVSQDIKGTGGGKFLTEFGLCMANASHNSTEYLECISVLGSADREALSWTYWDSAFFLPNGSVWTENVRLFSRTYAMAIAGTPVNAIFNADNGQYVLNYVPDSTIKAPTVIFVSPLHYPNGFTYKAANATVNVVNSHFVEVSHPSAPPGVTMTVVISRK